MDKDHILETVKIIEKYIKEHEKEIDKVLGKSTSKRKGDQITAMLHGVFGHSIPRIVSVATLIYDKDSPQMEYIKEVSRNSRIIKEIDRTAENMLRSLYDLHGITVSMRLDIKNGLLDKIATKVKAEIITDYINLGKGLLREGHKDSASAILCSTMERLLRSLAVSHGMEEYKGLTSTIGFLSGKARVLQGDFASRAKGFVSLRDPSFHGSWEEVDIEDVRRLAHFLEDLIAQHSEYIH